MTTTTKISDFAQRIKGLSDYRSDDHRLRSETASAFAALLEIVVERAPSAAGVEVLQAEVTDLRRQKSDLEVALAATMTAWHKDKAELEGQLAAVKQSSDRYHDEGVDLRTQLDTATKRADLAEATLESVRAAVAKPALDKEDTRPNIGDAVPWSEAEAGALYYRPDLPYAFRGVTDKRQCLLDGPHDEDLPRLLRGGGNPLSELLGGYLSSPTGVLIARDLGTDPEAWRAAMREYLAKVGK